MAHVEIDGVRYVPAREIAASVNDLKEALLDVYWGPGYRGSHPVRAEDGLFVVVTKDTDLGGEPFADFINSLIAKLAEMAPPSQEDGQ